MKDDRIILEMKDAGSEVPVECRLRALLKIALRRFGFRVTSIETKQPAKSGRREIR